MKVDADVLVDVNANVNVVHVRAQSEWHVQAHQHCSHSPEPPCLTGNSHRSSKPGSGFLFASCGEQFPAFLAEFQKQGEGRSGTLLECTNATTLCRMPGTH